MTTVSIIIPAYNAASYIDDALGAACSQTHQDLEIVVIDDGSQDGTAERIARHDDPRIRFHQQENAGQSAAINRGVELSTGEYIKLLDADDWIHAEHVAAQLDAIEGDAGAVASCRWGYFADNFRRPSVKEECTHRSYEDPMQWLIESLTREEGMMGGWMWLIPREVWDRCGGYDSRLSLNNDFHFSIALLLSSTGVRFAKESVYSYRKVPESLSGSQGRKAMESAILTTELGCNLLLQREDSPRIRSICADRYQQWLFRFYPSFPDLVAQSESRIKQLGGSSLRMQGGTMLKTLTPVIGWKGVRRLQQIAYRCGWTAILQKKAANRLSKFE